MSNGELENPSLTDLEAQRLSQYRSLRAQRLGASWLNVMIFFTASRT